MSGSCADDLALERILAAGKRDPNLVGVFDHVVVRQNVSLLIEHGARSGPFGGRRQHEEPIVADRLGENVHHAPIGPVVNADVGELFLGQAGIGRQATRWPAESTDAPANSAPGPRRARVGWFDSLTARPRRRLPTGHSPHNRRLAFSWITAYLAIRGYKSARSAVPVSHPVSATRKNSLGRECRNPANLFHTISRAYSFANTRPTEHESGRTSRRQEELPSRPANNEEDGRPGCRAAHSRRTG